MNFNQNPDKKITVTLRNPEVTPNTPSIVLTSDNDEIFINQQIQEAAKKLREKKDQQRIQEIQKKLQANIDNKKWVEVNNEKLEVKKNVVISDGNDGGMHIVKLNNKKGLF